MGSRSLIILARDLMLVPVIAIAFATSGCGGSSSDAAAGTASCTISETVTGGGSTLGSKLCQEVENLTAAQAQQFMQQCMLSGAGAGGLGADAGINAQAIYAAGPCSHNGALGGCRISQAGITSIAWYYQMGTFTSADIQQLCTTAGATFLPP